MTVIISMEILWVSLSLRRLAMQRSVAFDSLRRLAMQRLVAFDSESKNLVKVKSTN